MQFSRSRFAIAALLLLWTGAPAFAESGAEEEADVKIMEQHCQDYSDMARHGPLAGKFALAGDASITMMTDQTMPTDEDISELKIYAAATENCMNAQVILARKWVPPVLTAMVNHGVAQKLIFVDLLMKKISFGQANMREMEAARVYQTEYQAGSEKFNAANVEKLRAAQPPQQQPTQPQYAPPDTAYTPPPQPAIIPPLPILEMPPVIRPQTTCNTVRMGSQLQTVCR